MAAAGKAVKTKLFIGNLDPATQAGELNELFGTYGNVLEASVIKDYGFVHFGTIEEAEKAVAGLNNKEFHSKRLRVELSTSTVRHRPGQPEPASALRHSRTRQGVAGAAPSGSHSSRYGNSVPPSGGGGGGPMRHSSAWGRHDARPYPPMGREPPGIPPDYGLTPPHYERSRPYDIRSDNRSYYNDGPDTMYPPAYEMPPYGSNRNGDDVDVYGSRHYRDGHSRGPPPPPEPMGYGSNRGYDRHGDLPSVDPYYDNNGPSGGHDVDPYRNYDMYPKYYQGRGRPEPDYPGPPPPPVPPSSRDYDSYSNYRHDPYGPSNGQAPYRHHSNVPSPSQHQSGYPSNHRQQQPPPLPLYSNGGSSAGGSAYPPGAGGSSTGHSHYYGAHHRA